MDDPMTFFSPESLEDFVCSTANFHEASSRRSRLLDVGSALGEEEEENSIELSPEEMKLMMSYKRRKATCRLNSR